MKKHVCEYYEGSGWCVEFLGIDECLHCFGKGVCDECLD